MLLLVNAVLLATRCIMSSEAMTCTFRHHMRQPVQWPESWESTNLGLSEDRQEHIHNWDVGSPSHDKQQRAHGEIGRGLNEHGPG